MRLVGSCVVSAGRSKSGSSLNFRRMSETVLWLIDQSKDRSNLINIFYALSQDMRLHGMQSHRFDCTMILGVSVWSKAKGTGALEVTWMRSGSSPHRSLNILVVPARRVWAELQLRALVACGLVWCKTSLDVLWRDDPDSETDVGDSV